MPPPAEDAPRPRRFRDRRAAGIVLGERLQEYRGRSDVIVLGLPRGGVPVAAEVARALEAPLEVFLVRKLGVPGQEELAMGAIASGGARVLNEDVLRSLNLRETVIEAVTGRELAELERRERAFRGDRPPPDVHARVAIVVDDGLATGSTMRAAVAALRSHEPARIVVAVPTAPLSTCHDLRSEVDELVVLLVPQPFRAVGLWYEDFTPTSDDEVRAILDGFHGG